MQNKPENSKFIGNNIKILIDLCLLNIKHFSTEIDDEGITDWNLSKASAYLLCILVQFAPIEYIDILMKLISSNLISQDWRQKNEGLLIFGCVLESNFKDKIREILQNSLNGLFLLLGDQNVLVRRTTSWVISKCTELYPRVFDKNVISTLLPVFDKSFDDVNEVSINLLYALNNLIIANGDKETIKNNSKFTLI